MMKGVVVVRVQANESWPRGAPTHPPCHPAGADFPMYIHAYVGGRCLRLLVTGYACLSVLYIFSTILSSATLTVLLATGR